MPDRLATLGGDNGVNVKPASATGGPPALEAMTRDIVSEEIRSILLEYVADFCHVEEEAEEDEFE